MKSSVLNNAAWILCCKVIQSLLAFLIGIFTARYLGPSNYGLISYAASLVAFFAPIMQLGLNSTLVQEFLQKPGQEGLILGTSLVLNIVSALASVVGVTTFAFVANNGETETIAVCFLYSLTLIFQASEMTQYWFQSKLLSKYPSVASLIAYGIISLYKIYILISAKNVQWFAVTHVIEAAIVSIFLILIYRKVGGQKLSFSLPLGKEMISRSKYYISSGLIVVIFQQTDRIMLKSMISETQTGYYSAAFTCVGITGFVFSAIIDSMRPYILSAKDKQVGQFEQRLTMLFSVITYGSLAQQVGMTVFAKVIVGILFGSSYAPTVLVLQILVWQVMFGYYGTVRNIWILSEGKQRHLWKINLAGAVINIIGNSLLIPTMGAAGAALASVLTQLLINFVLCLIVKSLWPVGKIMIKSFNPKVLLGALKVIVN